MAVTCFLESPESARCASPGQGDAAYHYFETSGKTGAGESSHTPPSGGAETAAAGTAASASNAQLFAFSAKPCGAFFAPTASGMRCASFFICDQVGFLILSWGMRKEVGNSATLRNTTGGMVLAHCVFGGVVVFILLGAGWEAG